MYSILISKNVLEFSSQGYNRRLFTKMAWFDWMTRKKIEMQNTPFFVVLLEYILHTYIFCDFDTLDTLGRTDICALLVRVDN